jgi:hypothetical protein
LPVNFIGQDPVRGKIFVALLARLKIGQEIGQNPSLNHLYILE